MQTLRSLSLADRAAFAVSSRLLSCLVTESLLKAIFIPVDPSSSLSGTCGTCVILSNKANISNVPVGRPYHPSDVFLLVSLRFPPILKKPVDDAAAAEVGLVDPSDMLPWIFEIREDHNPRQADASSMASAFLSHLLSPKNSLLNRQPT